MTATMLKADCHLPELLAAMHANTVWEYAKKAYEDHNRSASMFDGIKNFFHEVQIKADFPQYENSKLQAHVAEAERRFDTAQLEREVAAIKEGTCRAMSEKFGLDTAALNYEIAILEGEVRRTRGNLAIFERDYKWELNELHNRKKELRKEKDGLIEEMKALQEERTEAHESLQDAYDRLEAAKNSIDHWYSKSERTRWLFGNGGKKLPKHSLFGQSFGDLEGYKLDRGIAVSDIRNSKIEVSEIKGRQRRNKECREENKAALRKVFDQINATEAVRQQMYELKQQGMKYSVLKKELSKYLSDHTDWQNRLHALEAESNTLTEEMECRLGIREREAKIAELKARKAQFLEEFHSPGSQESRRADHRKWWMFEHGVNQEG
jgi:chromosome segregation ATPase